MKRQRANDVTRGGLETEQDDYCNGLQLAGAPNVVTGKLLHVMKLCITCRHEHAEV